MKTLVQKFTLIVAIAVASLTLNAQNTKSVHAGLLKNKLTDQVSMKVNHISHELAFQLDKMKELVKYSPSNIENELFETAVATTDHIAAMTELESTIMFRPENIENVAFTELPTLPDYLIAAIELENIAKYRPSEENCIQNISICELENLTSQLANVVRFTPSSIF